MKSQNNIQQKPLGKIFNGLFCLISQYCFGNKGNVHNISGIRYLKGYLKDKTVFYDTNKNVLYIEKEEKPLYKITIEKL